MGGDCGAQGRYLQNSLKLKALSFKLEKMQYDFKPLKQKLAEVEGWLVKEMGTVRTSRATPTLLDGVRVEAYGALMPVPQVATVTIEDARTLRVFPWDASLAKGVEKAITAANLGVSVSPGDLGVRVSFPDLTAERRVSLIKAAKEKLEEARKSLRVARDEVWHDIQKREKKGEMAEDDKFRFKDEMEKLVNGAGKKLEDIFARKEKEITG